MSTNSSRKSRIEAKHSAVSNPPQLRSLYCCIPRRTTDTKLAQRYWLYSSLWALLLFFLSDLSIGKSSLLQIQLLRPQTTEPKHGLHSRIILSGYYNTALTHFYNKKKWSETSGNDVSKITRCRESIDMYVKSDCDIWRWADQWETMTSPCPWVMGVAPLIYIDYKGCVHSDAPRRHSESRATHTRAHVFLTSFKPPYLQPSLARVGSQTQFGTRDSHKAPLLLL